MILDTNAVSALAENDGNISALVQSAEEIAIPVIVIGEYRFGIQNSRKRLYYEPWLQGFLRTTRILSIDGYTTHYYADIRTELKRLGRPIPPNDLWIAALVLQHNLPLLSRDAHFDVVPGLRRLSW